MLPLEHSIGLTSMLREIPVPLSSICPDMRSQAADAGEDVVQNTGQAADELGNAGNIEGA